MGKSILNQHITVNKKESLEKLIRDAGKILLKYRNTQENLKIDTKSDGSKVTEADYASNKILSEGLLSLFPDFELISEEIPFKISSESPDKPTWIIDPLDGTKSFIEGKDDFSILAGLAYKEEIILGIVYFPVLNLFAVAQQGAGSFVNGRKIAVSGNIVLTKGRIFGRQTEEFFGDLLYPTSVDSGIAFLKIAQGEFDAAIIKHGALSIWDLAAPSIVISEAGGKVTDENGGAISFLNPNKSYKYFLASNGLIHEKIQSQINSNGYKAVC